MISVIQIHLGKQFVNFQEAGCWDTGINSQSDGQPGAFRQSRGGSISLDSVWAWLPIEQYRVNW